MMNMMASARETYAGPIVAWDLGLSADEVQLVRACLQARHEQDFIRMYLLCCACAFFLALNLSRVHPPHLMS